MWKTDKIILRELTTCLGLKEQRVAETLLDLLWYFEQPFEIEVVSISKIGWRVWVEDGRFFWKLQVGSSSNNGCPNVFSEMGLHHVE